MASQEELQLDIEDLNRLIKVCVRPRVKDLLIAEIKRCEAAIAHCISSEVKASEPAPEVKASVQTTEQSTDAHALQSKMTIVPQKYYKEIMNYAWDQSDKFMKIYVSLSSCEGHTGLTKDNVMAEFTEKSFHLKLENLANKNYKCHVGFLWGKIVPGDSFFKLKSDSVLLMLKKAEEKKTWPYVTEREGKDDKKKTGKFDDGDKNKDPNESLMNLMQKMYDDGDDEMKRTIAKAWSESRNKTGGPGPDL